MPNRLLMRIGRYDRERLVYLVRAGEYYLHSSEDKTIRVLDNGCRLKGAKRAREDMWVESSGLWHLQLPGEHIRGEYVSVNEKPEDGLESKL
jgi:hypothetical protein